jgi:cellulase/cellobiase CelA1
VYEYDDVNYYQARSPSGFARQQGFAYNGQTTTNSFETGRSHYTSRIESYPYRDRHWSDRHVFDEVRFSEDQYNYYQSRDGYDRFREKWWDKGHNEYESNLNGEFGP